MTSLPRMTAPHDEPAGAKRSLMADSPQTPAPVQRVAIYCRVSTDKQAAKEDSSLDTQRDRLIRYIEDKQRAGQNWQLAQEFVEGEDKDGKRRGCSGKNLDRPGFSQLMEKVRARLVDVVVFTKMDRISRNVVDFLTLVEEFERYNVKLVSLKEEINTASASGRVMTTIMIALAQFEREQISERTREKMAWRAGKGLPIGPPPLGYEMHEKRYRPVPQGVEWVRFLDRTYLETRSLDKTTRAAFEKGVRTRKGHTLTKKAISHILQNPFYTGKIVHNGEAFPGQHESIRDEATHARIGQLLARNHHRKGNGTCKSTKYDYLLQGLVVCGSCGGRMVPKSARGRNGTPHYYYVCSAAEKTAGIACRRNHLPAVAADQHVLEFVRQLALRDDLIRQLCSERDASFADALQKLRQDRDCVKVSLADVRREATNLGLALARLADEPPRALLELSRGYNRQEQELEATLARMGEEITKLEQVELGVDLAGRTVRYLAAILDHKAVTPAHLKDLLPKFINSVTWTEEPGTRQGRLDVALFERPFRKDRGRLLREVVDDLRSDKPADAGLNEPTNGHNGLAVAHEATGSPPSVIRGALADALRTYFEAVGIGSQSGIASAQRPPHPGGPR